MLYIINFTAHIKTSLFFRVTIYYNMSLFYIQFVFFLLISYNYVFGLIKLPICQCECCPGEECQSQLLVFSVDKCNKTTCSFKQCYRMYPKKCGLMPGITNAFCDVVNQTKTNSIILRLSNDASSNIILPIMILINILFCFLFKLLIFI
jgi:hypothetical protein